MTTPVDYYEDGTASCSAQTTSSYSNGHSVGHSVSTVRHGEAYVILCQSYTIGKNELTLLNEISLLICQPYFMASFDFQIDKDVFCCAVNSASRSSCNELVTELSGFIQKQGETGLSDSLQDNSKSEFHSGLSECLK